MTTLGPRLARERKTIQIMVRLYCRDHHGVASELCAGCQTLLNYAERRLGTCPFQEEKPACNRCEVHCYSQTMRAKVKDVMRYAGPRLLFRNPLLSVFHLLAERRPVPSLPSKPKRG